MKKAHAQKLGISVLLTGCGGGSNGITNTIDNNADAFTSAANANAKPQRGGVIQSSINNTSGLGVDTTKTTTKTTLDFKRVAGGQDVTVDTSDSDGMLECPYAPPIGNGFTTIFDYEKKLANGDFVVLGGVANYGTGANDYLSFGLWNYEAIDGTMSEVGAYAYGGDPFTQANIAGLTGTANYKKENGAVGAYIYNEGEGDGIDVLLGDVSLTANFDTDTISGNIKTYQLQLG